MRHIQRRKPMTQQLPLEEKPLKKRLGMKGLAELDHRILTIEHRLMDREAGLRQRVRTLQLRMENAPRRWAAPALVGVTAFAGMFLLVRSRRRSHGASGKPSDGKGINWMHYVGLAWPLLPAQWRSRISPTTVLPLVGLLMPLLDQVFPSQRSAPPLDTVPQADLDRFAGRWFEIASLPAPAESACTEPAIIEYRARPKGRVQGWASFDVVRRCRSVKGRQTQTQGVAVPVEGSAGARLKVSDWPAWLRWLPAAWVDHGILHLDEACSEALVGDVRRRFLVVLSRAPTMAPERLEALLSQAQRQGFDTTRVVHLKP